MAASYQVRKEGNIERYIERFVTFVNPPSLEMEIMWSCVHKQLRVIAIKTRAPRPLPPQDCNTSFRASLTTSLPLANNGPAIQQGLWGQNVMSFALIRSCGNPFLQQIRTKFDTSENSDFRKAAFQLGERHEGAVEGDATKWSKLEQIQLFLRLPFV